MQPNSAVMTKTKNKILLEKIWVISTHVTSLSNKQNDELIQVALNEVI